MACRRPTRRRARPSRRGWSRPRRWACHGLCRSCRRGARAGRRHGRRRLNRLQRSVGEAAQFLKLRQPRPLMTSRRVSRRWNFSRLRTGGSFRRRSLAPSTPRTRSWRIFLPFSRKSRRESSVSPSRSAAPSASWRCEAARLGWRGAALLRRPSPLRARPYRRSSTEHKIWPRLTRCSGPPCLRRGKYQRP